MIDDQSLSDELNVFANELRQQTLQLTPRDRDQLMFECGKAAAVESVDPPRRSVVGSWLKQGLLVACSMSFGALVMHQQMKQVESRLATLAEDDPHDTSESNALAAKLNEFYSAEQISAVRSHQLLCVSSDPEIVTETRMDPATIPPDPLPALRARMIDRFGLMP